MSKRLLCFVSVVLALLLCSGAWADVSLLDETIFPDENFVYYLLYSVDSDMDFTLTDEELESVTSMLDAWGWGITSLKGIEYFPNLVVLDCSRNALTELDLSGNPNLERLDCSRNDLVSLDISGNPKLTLLHCYFSSKNRTVKENMFHVDIEVSEKPDSGIADVVIRQSSDEG